MINDSRLRKLVTLTSLLCVVSVCCNVISSKVVSLLGFYFPASAIFIPITFLLSSIIQEDFGKQYSIDAMFISFLCQIASVCIFLISSFLPYFEANMQYSFNTILGNNSAFVFASIVSYFASMSLNRAFVERFKRNSVFPGIISSIVDTLVFLMISYGLGYRYLFSSDTITILWSMIIIQSIIKILVFCVSRFLLLCIKEKH